MSALSWITLILGLLALGGGFIAVRAPEAVRRGLERYPRSVWPGRVLLAVDMTWAAWAINQMHLGGFDAWKVHLIWLAPILIIAGCVYLDELLSVRALGGLLLLAAGPMLNAARWHPSPWRLVIPILAYLWIIAGLFFVLEPWWFRRAARCFPSASSVRAAGFFKIASGAGLIVLALLVY
jgi:hypothetical protein